MSPPTQLQVAAATDVGRVRSNNQDNYYVGADVFAVADGMGGHVGGEIASSEALEPIAELDAAGFASAEEAVAALREAIVEANRRVVAHGQSDPALHGMGTTLTVGLVRDGALHLAHVGDSRAYLLRDNELVQLTTDHNLVEQMVQDGRLTRDEAATHPQRNVITRAIGVERDIQVDAHEALRLRPGDQVLLCSDGLTGPVEDEQIARLLTADAPGDAVVRDLIDAANEAGGPDNITVVLLRVHEEDDLIFAAPDTADAAGGDGHTTRELPRPTHAISTVPASRDDDWAQQFGRYGQQQGTAGSGRDDGAGHRRTRRWSVALVAVVVLVVLAGAGAYGLMTRAYFLRADDDGQVRIYNGLSEEVGGVALHWEVEPTDLMVDELPAYRQRMLREGVDATSLEQARRTAASWAEEARDDAEAAPEDTDDPGTP